MEGRRAQRSGRRRLRVLPRQQDASFIEGRSSTTHVLICLISRNHPWYLLMWNRRSLCTSQVYGHDYPAPRLTWQSRCWCCGTKIDNQQKKNNP
jgi:hypothetical protein